MACGLLRPVILLPEHTDWSDEARLTYALTHEYVHIRRGDLAWKPLLAAACACTGSIPWSGSCTSGPTRIWSWPVTRP